MSLSWRKNRSDMWAWFDGDTQVTGAYREESWADYALEVHGLRERAPQSSEPSFDGHSEYSRLVLAYGADVDELDKVIATMTADISRHQVAARREFNGNGGRRTSAAVSAQAARDLGQEKLLVGCLRSFLKAKHNGGGANG